MLVTLLVLVLAVGTSQSAELTRVNSIGEITLTLPDPSGELEIFALPVGQGDCTIIQCPSGKLVVFDCGSSGGTLRLLAEQVKKFLGKRLADVVSVIISHPDKDHFNYLPETGIQPKRVIIGAKQDYCNKKNNKICQWLSGSFTLNTVSNEKNCIGNCTVPGGTDFCGNPNIKFDILAANVGATNNQRSIVMKISSDQFTALLPGDMEGAAAKKIAKKLPKGQLKSLIYKVSHHGAIAANMPAWLEEISPSASYVSSAYNFTRLYHPQCTTITNLRDLGSLDTTVPHDIYCCNKSKPMPLKGFKNHIYETSPAPDKMCFLWYTSALKHPFGHYCYQVLLNHQPSIKGWLYRLLSQVSVTL